MENVVNEDGCAPDTPAPQTDEPEYCQGTFKMEKCCCEKLVSRTFIVPINPQSQAQLQNFLQGTASNYESQGYVILGHGLVDTGAGWIFSITIGWYQ